MIKRIFLTSLLVVGSFLTSFADEQKKIILNNSEHTKETIELAYCNIFVSLKDVDDNAEITVELENIHESNTLILFERAYDEKTLKKMSPSITYDKVFGGSKGKRYIDACTELRFTNKIGSSEKAKLLVKTTNEKSPVVCKLPIYIAKYKNKRRTKMLLLAKEVIELDIQVQLKPDEEYINFVDSFNALIKEIDQTTFCTHKNHKYPKGTTIKTLTGNFEDKIKTLKNQVNSAIDKRFELGKDIKKFRELVDKIDAISIDDKKIETCGNDPTPIPYTHKCKHCSLDYDDIYRKLETHYINIRNGNVTKSKVMTDVDALYTCALKNKKRPSDSNKVRRITTCYNRIKSLK